MTEQTTPIQVNELVEALTNATPESLATAINNSPALKKKLATALCCETIEGLQELVASISDIKADGRLITSGGRIEGKIAVPFAFIGKMQKFFIPNTEAVPDAKAAYRQNVTARNQHAKTTEDWDGYTFRLLRKENGALLVKVPSSRVYSWAEAIEEYALYGLTPIAADFLGHGNATQNDFTSYRIE